MWKKMNCMVHTNGEYMKWHTQNELSMKKDLITWKNQIEKWWQLKNCWLFTLMWLRGFFSPWGVVPVVDTNVLSDIRRSFAFNVVRGKGEGWGGLLWCVLMHPSGSFQGQTGCGWGEVLSSQSDEVVKKFHPFSIDVGDGCRHIGSWMFI